MGQLLKIENLQAKVQDKQILNNAHCNNQLI